MDPAIGASTCALGSHKWTENIGSLTRKPLIINNESRRLRFKGGERVIVVML